MAVTQGHGNPNWTQDETILALELYQQLHGVIPSKTDPRVIELSETLRSLPLHDSAATRMTFRNPDGVVFKLQNLRAVAVGMGLQNVSRVDRQVWQVFGERPEYVAQIATVIRSASPARPPDIASLPTDEVFAEGRLLTLTHRARERDPRLRDRLLKSRAAKGSLVCELCGGKGWCRDPEYADAIFEVHHVQPLSLLGEGITRLADLALLCACCHRLAHRVIAVERRWLSMESLRGIIKNRN